MKKPEVENLVSISFASLDIIHWEKTRLLFHKIIHLVHDSMLPHATASHTVLLLAMKSAGDRGVGGRGGLWAKQTLAGHKGKKSGI
jgi:hypothetical protein